MSDMGTTLVTAIADGPSVTLANVGDSRAYLVHQTGLRQLTRDHSWKEEEEERQMQLSAEEVAALPLRDMITRSLGLEPEVEVDLFDVDLERGDALLLCSDGIHHL